MTQHSPLTRRLIDDGLRPRQEAAAYERVRDAAPELLAVLIETRRLVGLCAESGFTDEAAVMALFVNNGTITRAIDRAIAKATGQ